MSSKSKIITFSVVVGAVVFAILIGYISSEFFSLKHWNPIKRVYLENILVKAEVVKSSKKIELGLAGREKLDKGRGMLFVMSEDSLQRFWMRGMRFPIDIIWIKKDRVIGCEERVAPEDQRIFTSPGKVSFVLEVEAGFCDENNIKVNDRVRIQ